MSLVCDHAQVCLRRPSALLLLTAVWGFARVGWAEEPARPPRLTATQQKQLQQAERHQVRALQFFLKNKNAESIAEWQKMLALERAAWGKDHPNLVPSLQALARLQEAAEDFPAARQALREVLGIQTRQLGEKHWQAGDARRALADLDFRAKLKPADRALFRQADSLDGQVVRLWRAGRSRQALPLAQRAVAIRGKLLGEGHPAYATSLFNLAAQYETLAEYARAEPLFQRSLAIREARLGKGHPDVATCLAYLAEVYREQGQYAKAEPLFQRSLAIREARLGKDHPDVATSLNNLAALYRDQSQYAKAEPLLRRSLQISEARLGKDHPDVAACLHNLAGLYREQGQYAKAEPLFKRSLAIVEATLGKDDPHVADILDNLAGLYRDQSQYAKAEPLLRRSLQIREARLGKDHPDVADSLNNLALVYQAQGQYAKAEPLLQRSLAISEASFGKDHPDVATSLNNLAALYNELGQYAKAEPLFKRSLAISEARLGKDHLRVAASLNNLAMLYKAQGQYARAEPLLQRSLAISEARLGKDRLRVAGRLNNLALLYQAQGQYAKAEPLLRHCLTIFEARLGKDHPDVAGRLNNLAGLYRAQGQYARAEPLLQRSLTIYEARLGKNHPDVANCLHNLAVLYNELGQYAKAEPLFKRSLAISEARLGKDHLHVAGSLNNLAYLYQDQGQYARAEPLYRRSLAIYEARLGKDHPDVANCLNNLARLYGSQGDWGEAAQTFDKARRGVRQHLHQVLPALSPQEQLTFLHTRVQGPLHAALSLALRRRADPGLAEHAAAWLLNSKALTQQALAGPLLLARAGAQPQLTALHAQLLDVRQRLARLTLATPRPGQEERRRQLLDDLARQERRLARELGRKSSEQLADLGWVELAAVRQALPSDAVLIDIARVDVLDFRAKGREPRWQAARYAAWVIPPQGKGKVCLVDLGEADAIETAVQAVRQQLADAPQTLAGQNEAVVEQHLRRTLTVLARQVLRPLAGHVGKTKHWIVSPDAALWLVPWTALPLADGSYAIEKHRISYVVSGRDLVRSQPTAPPSPPLVLADPDFDLEPTRAGRGAESAEVSRGLLSAEALPRFKRLAGTAVEARAIAPLLKRYAEAQLMVRTGQQALEGVFKAARRPRVLVLSTHGFFLEDQDHALVPPTSIRGITIAPGKRPRPRGKKVQVLENPLLRCGLALAGANQRDRAPEGAEDGILTGLEIVGCDLRGTELVVLSACDTGLGRVNVGEGVACLRQAFQLAGAQAVVATLWQIPDTETAELMKAFFTHLAAKKGKAEALRQAQLLVIKQRRARGKAAHPFFWAAFTLTGQWQ
jgi:CHAT domain-containing protein/tetratricopeptide (TPR) repeat protein